MQTIHYEQMLTLIGRLDPRVDDLAQEITNVDDAMAEIVHALGTTAAAQTAGLFGENHLGPNMVDVQVRAENALHASRCAAQEWQRADLAMSAQAQAESVTGPTPTSPQAV